jgi:hypothetical protein
MQGNEEKYRTKGHEWTEKVGKKGRDKRKKKETNK